MKLPADIKEFYNYKEEKFRPYEAIDHQGNKVVINPKDPDKHGMNHPLESNTTVYYSLGEIVKNPESVMESTSKNPKAIAYKEQGRVLTYIKKDYATKLNIPGYLEMKGDITEVVVFYPKKGVKNYSLTYHIKPK